MSESPMFAVKERVVYPGQGVGEIKEISKKAFKDQMLNYYEIYFEESDMTVLVPVEKVQDLGIRTIVSKEKAEAALDFLAQEFQPSSQDWKLRYQTNLDLFKHGDILDNAEIVRSLYHRGKIKELPVQERKLYDSVCRIFEDELCSALGLSKEKTLELIHSRLEQFGGKDLGTDDTYDVDLDDDDFDDDFDD